MMPTYTFTEEQARAAHEEWGCNCGPAALAFALQRPLGDVRHAIPNFETRHYTAPKMMQAALAHFKQRYMAISCPFADGSLRHIFYGPMTLVRVQWTGPWIVEGKPQKWASRQTHWIACWQDHLGFRVFDVNGGIRSFGDWEEEIVPAIVATIKRADGDWYPANIWRFLE